MPVELYAAVAAGTFVVLCGVGRALWLIGKRMPENLSQMPAILKELPAVIRALREPTPTRSLKVEPEQNPPLLPPPETP